MPLWPPPLLRDRPRALQIVFAVVVPIAFGAVCGVVLGESGLWFQILMLGGGVGGVNAGFEHDTLRGGLARGASGGALFAAALLITHEARDVPALAHLPLALPVMAIGYAVMGTPLGGLGGWLRCRSAGRTRRTA
jgi:hypothetical protein